MTRLAAGAEARAEVESSLGAVLLRYGKPDEAVSHMRRALAILEAELGPRHPGWR